MADNTTNDNNLTLEEQLAKIKGEQAARIAELEQKVTERDAMIKKYLTSGGGEKTDESSADDETEYIKAKVDEVAKIIKKWRS